ncbi:MAG: dimethyl sulfoxide reductase anchor subunit family protein [Cognatishimia sp.]|uniref:dimethyl sulfoxide reductase anchor subunit family protein n=1 Tax=Cognatishimia sp. 1_MG-2023 TaxID=3062642 RepID=UPI0026E1A3F9|nr:DmsC/YnfH family molybdoenzyme membrane anchor subunit [Cognatishimia sp. 1_MG-2023]MDO6727844.1 dimethyl sulfoxide reductase anchor subunit [Cognatishimia sp. 1_MG-2023]
MHPAPSVIVFSVLSGIGFGMLAWLGIESTPATGMTAFWWYLVAFGLAVVGLVSSTFHLGHPERALKAFTQWRTSWLSREGVCAVLALCVMGLYAAALIFMGTHIAILGWIGAALSLITVYTTSMIYGQLATIPRWNTPLTTVLFLTFSITGGALISGRISTALVLLVASAFVQVIWWKKGDTAFADRGSDLGTATGLGKRGTVRSMAHPHTSPNYLMREFIHVIGRKHAQKLRVISLVLMAGVPVVLLVLPFNHIFGLLAVLSHLAGVATSRWLFFAEAEHTVGIYYGAR